MLTRSLISILLTLFFYSGTAQEVRLDTLAVDTMQLSVLKAKKVVAYKMNDSTICYISYNAYLKYITAYQDIHRNDKKELRIAIKKGQYINPGAMRNLLLFDSLYLDAKKQAKKRDTIFVTQNYTDSTVQGTENDLIAAQIDQNKCAVFINGKIQPVIIRLKCSWHLHSRAAWLGRRYFIPGSKVYFLSGTDLIA